MAFRREAKRVHFRQWIGCEAVERHVKRDRLSGAADREIASQRAAGVSCTFETCADELDLREDAIVHLTARTGALGFSPQTVSSAH